MFFRIFDLIVVPLIFVIGIALYLFGFRLLEELNGTVFSRSFWTMLSGAFLMSMTGARVAYWMVFAPRSKFEGILGKTTRAR